MKKFLAILGAIALCGCSNKNVSHQNYDKIQNNMSVAQVTKILGKPTDDKVINIAGLVARTTSWDKNGNSILVTFVDDKVSNKNFTKDFHKHS